MNEFLLRLAEKLCVYLMDKKVIEDFIFINKGWPYEWKYYARTTHLILGRGEGTQRLTVNLGGNNGK